jgi:hypothetical protein
MDGPQATSLKHQATSCDKMPRVNLSNSNHLASVLKIDFNERYKNMLVKEARKITDSLTRTSKMPGLSYSLPAWECKTGSKLRKVKNSVCSACYALKGNYTRYPAIKIAQYRRLAAIKLEGWTRAMAAQILRQKFFRWHLNKIYEVCELTPDVKHWMPTREAWIKDHLDRKPSNLVIRFSPPMIGQRNDSWPNSSMVVETGATCPAPSQDGKCGSCRQCWDPLVKVVSYGKH